MNKIINNLSIIIFQIGNLIQEIGRAGRDKIQSKSVLFFSRNDIRSIYSIVTGGRER
jgi:superfamily II DNA helicase RecQ